MCGEEADVQIYRQNTAYVDEELNWVECCVTCYAMIEEYWRDMWEMYRSMVM